MSLAAVGFDLDYTLCVPARDRSSLLEEAVASVGASPTAAWATRSAYQSAHDQHLTGETRAPIFEAMLDDADVETDPARLAQAYRQRVNGALEPVAGAATLVQALRREYRVGLLTNGPLRAQRSKLETLGWSDAFDVVLVSGELSAGKPDGRAFRALLDGLDVTAPELAYVGDDPEADIAGASRVGCHTVQVVRDGGPAPDPRADAHVRIDQLADALPDVIAALD